MSGFTLTPSATMQCAHGGMITGTSASSRANAGGAPMLTMNDVFVVAGCPFAPGGVPLPCLTVQWIVPDTRVTVAGGATLSASSVGLTLNVAQAPQGPVVIAATQTKVQSQ